MKLGVTEEGKLVWIPLAEVLDLNASAITRYILKHYLNGNERTDDILVGTVRSEAGIPKMTWATLQDWETTAFDKLKLGSLQKNT